MGFGKHLIKYRLALAAGFLALALGSSLAQPANVEAALREACGRDFAMYCAGVQPGGGRVIGCLRLNQARLSPVCRETMARLGGGPPPLAVPAPVAPPPRGVVVAPPPVVGPTPAEIAMRACERDRLRLCGGVVPGEGHVLECLLQSIRAVTPVCREALAALPR